MIASPRNEKSKEKPVKIFLINNSGTLFWSNIQYSIEKENEDVLLSAIFTALSQFTKEIINEELQSLRINDYNFMFFDIKGFYQIVIFYPLYLHIDQDRIKRLRDQVIHLYLEIMDYSEAELPDPEEFLPMIIAVLSDFDLELHYKYEHYKIIKEKIMKEFINKEPLLHEKECGLIVLGWNGERVYSYTSNKQQGMYLLNYFLKNSHKIYELKDVLHELRLNAEYGDCQMFLIQDFILVVCWNQGNPGKQRKQTVLSELTPVIEKYKAIIDRAYLDFLGQVT